MTDLNNVTLIGRVTKDGELSYTQNGKAVLNFSIANNRSYKSGKQWQDEASFFDCRVWGSFAESLMQRLAKGVQVAVSGRLQQDKWKDKQTGQWKSKVYILADSVQVLTRSEQGSSFQQNVQQGGQQDAQQNFQQNVQQVFQQGNQAYGDDVPF